jgi:hypothetical protein
VSVFTTTDHLFLRDPRGGVEDVAAMQAAGFGSVFCNVGDHAPDTWQTIRDRARAAGVVCGPWLRTATSAGDFDVERFHKLLDIADAWATPLIVNAESELKGSGAELTTYIDAQLGARDAAISMESVPFADVEWWPIGDRPVLPQVFLADVDVDALQVRELWHAYGVRCVVLTFGSYGGSRPDDYDLLSPFGLYTADDCAQNYAAWSSRGTCTPCVNDPAPIDPDPGNGGETMAGKGAAASATEAWDAWLGTDSKRTAWERDNPGEWSALQSYASAAAGTAAPTTIKSKTGRMLLAIVESRRWAEGSHA